MAKQVDLFDEMYGDIHSNVVRRAFARCILLRFQPFWTGSNAMKDNATIKRLLRTFLKILAGGSVIVFSVYTFSWGDKPTYGFAMYYTYSRMIFEREDLTKIYDFDYFNSKVHESGINTIDMPNNPPTAALPMMAIAWLPARTAKIVWSLLSVALFIWSLKILFSLYDIAPLKNVGLGLLALAFLFRPAYDGIALGQMYFVILFLFSLSLWSFSRNQKQTAAVPLGLTFVIKVTGLFHCCG